MFLDHGSDASTVEVRIKEFGQDNTCAVQADVSTMDGVEHQVKSTVDKYKKIDVLVPNAGIMPLKTLSQKVEKILLKLMP